MRDYAASFERVTKVAAMLLAGAVLLLTWAWDKLGIGQPGAPASGSGVGVVLVCVALAWAVGALQLVWRAAMSNRLDAGANYEEIEATFMAQGGRFEHGVAAPNDAALHLVRLRELGRRGVATKCYVAALNARAQAINTSLWIASVAAVLGALATVLALVR